MFKITDRALGAINNRLMASDWLQMLYNEQIIVK
jgi:hypothetical protein